MIQNIRAQAAEEPINSIRLFSFHFEIPLDGKNSMH